MTRRYLPTTVPGLRAAWDATGPGTDGAVEAVDDTEESEYSALMTAADASAVLLPGLPDGDRRRVVVVVESGAAATPSWRDVVAVHLDDHDDADPEDDLGWWALQEVAALL